MSTVAGEQTAGSISGNVNVGVIVTIAVTEPFDEQPLLVAST